MGQVGSLHAGSLQTDAWPDKELGYPSSPVGRKAGLEGSYKLLEVGTEGIFGFDIRSIPLWMMGDGVVDGLCAGLTGSAFDLLSLVL